MAQLPDNVHSQSLRECVEEWNGFAETVAQGVLFSNQLIALIASNENAPKDQRISRLRAIRDSVIALTDRAYDIDLQIRALRILDCQLSTLRASL